MNHDHANLRQRSPSYSPPRSSNRRSPSYEAPRRNSDRCCIASNQNFSIKCIGLDPGTRGAPGLLHLEAGKTMGGKNMRKILACLRLVERRSRRSILGKDRIQSCWASFVCFRMPKRSRSRSPSQRSQIPWEDEETLRSLNCKACNVRGALKTNFDQNLFLGLP